ncbi:hypothetical protein Airi02_062730 [Actinoallomurus iriomotensis]|uniref:Uncharacterized protein n=1 Tax=Actinoallomurus iriomotensis TaxID=478107 RepID=A0A9W6W2D7_9ACTN|nr:hypothetical protein [Actinoallomurus iriomotensis]GLY88344.1 hypothetical protein Airi02_062730 [Actinoallomurus iriomotensis]
MAAAVLDQEDHDVGDLFRVADPAACGHLVIASPVAAGSGSVPWVRTGPEPTPLTRMPAPPNSVAL